MPHTGSFVINTFRLPQADAPWTELLHLVVQKLGCQGTLEQENKDPGPKIDPGPRVNYCSKALPAACARMKRKLFGLLPVADSCQRRSALIAEVLLHNRRGFGCATRESVCANRKLRFALRAGHGHGGRG